MSTQRIEIYPGVTIEVSARLKRKAGVGRQKLVRDKIDEGERRRILGDMARDQKPTTRHSTLILNEAARLSAEVGIKKASKITGLGYWTIAGWKSRQNKAGKMQPYNGRRYTKEKVAACIALAKKIMTEVRPSTGRNWPPRAAFEEAGNRLGVKGWCIFRRHYQYAPSNH